MHFLAHRRLHLDNLSTFGNLYFHIKSISQHSHRGFLGPHFLSVGSLFKNLVFVRIFEDLLVSSYLSVVYFKYKDFISREYFHRIFDNTKCFRVSGINECYKCYFNFLFLLQLIFAAYFGEFL